MKKLTVTLEVLCCASQELRGQVDLLERRKFRLNKQNDGNNWSEQFQLLELIVCAIQ